MKTPKNNRVGRSWHLTYPERWRQELAALRAAGLGYRISRPSGGVRLWVDFPTSSDEVVALRVDFDLFPWFPPTVTDPTNGLGLSRHRHPVAGTLCLVHREEGWDSNTSVADLLLKQVPKLLATRAEAVAGQSLAGVVEVPIAEGANAWRAMSSHAVVVPMASVPSGEHGELLARASANGRLSAIVLEEIQDDYKSVWQQPIKNLDLLAPNQIVGEWLRLTDYDPVWSTEELWSRVEQRLSSVDRRHLGETGSLLPSLRLVGLLVPGEPSFRIAGEEWVFLLEYTPKSAGPSSRPTVVSCPTQHLQGQKHRDPHREVLSERHVTIVGAGAIGHHIAASLARSGVGRLDIIDRDIVDIATAGRQHAPLLACGAPKAYALAAHVIKIAPTVASFGHHLDIAHLAADESYAAEVRHALAKADLVIDASANLAVNRYLGAMRHAAGRPILHVSATAGAWGGVVALTSPDVCCWACVEHHRHDGTVPEPPADLDGWTLPPGCGNPTFTGSDADLASVANHAVRVAAHHLVDDSVEPTFWTAAMRTQDGREVPINWSETPLATHPDCPLHDPALRPGRGAA